MTISGHARGQSPKFWALAPALAVVALSLACSSSVEQTTLRELQRIEPMLAEPADPELAATTAVPTSDGRESAQNGSLPSYLSYAFANNPDLRASFEQWRAKTYAPALERRLPDPVITYAVFLRSVETRVGPQRHRLGAMQWFPWPTRLSAGGKAAGLEAQAAQRRFEAHALKVAAEVSRAYWKLWQIERDREVFANEVAVLESLSEQIRVHLEVGHADLAAVAQIDLRLSRSRDRLVSLDQLEKAASAELVRTVGAPDEFATPIDDRAPAIGELAEDTRTLVAAAGTHPNITALATMADASEQRYRKARAGRLPTFGVGVDWIITGESPAAQPPPDSGQDAVALKFGLKIPIAVRAYKAAEGQARAQKAVYRSQAIGARNRATAAVRTHVAQLQENARRTKLYETTLVPQAQTAFEAVLNSYAAGRSSVADILLAERELIALQNQLFAAQASYGSHLADLESVVGRPLANPGVDHVQR